MLPSDEATRRRAQVWKAAIDNHPALIARCSGVVGVVRAVEFARETSCSVRCAAGRITSPASATCDGGIVIDLSRMRGIRLDLVRRTVRVEAGGYVGRPRRRDTGIRGEGHERGACGISVGWRARTGT
jgi:FAD/FMN-containing dehydrogenase